EIETKVIAIPPRGIWEELFTSEPDLASAGNFGSVLSTPDTTSHIEAASLSVFSWLSFKINLPHYPPQTTIQVRLLNLPSRICPSMGNTITQKLQFVQLFFNYILKIMYKLIRTLLQFLGFRMFQPCSNIVQIDPENKTSNSNKTSVPVDNLSGTGLSSDDPIE
ncbi:hypothetical protein J6590_106639, partial [Homalodisca vitripennis]